MFKNSLWSGLATLLSVILLILIVAATVLIFQNRAIQADINQRQQYINQSAQLSQINQALIQALATASIKNTGIKQILSAAGLNVTYRPNAQPAPQSPASPPAETAKPANPKKAKP